MPNSAQPEPVRCRERAAADGGSKPRGRICEIFASIQGEGLFCGQRQTFVRFAGCNLDCRYCDTPSAREAYPGFCRVETSPAAGLFRDVGNPVSVETILCSCRRLGSRAVTLTGGEPLLQPDFAAALAHALAKESYQVHLETNGTLHEALPTILPSLAVIAMDVKMPGAAGLELWDRHERFLDVAAGSDTVVFVKAVVSSETTESEIDRCAALIASRNRSIPLVIQPVAGETVDGRRLIGLQEVALARIDDVRVIPQCHRMLGLP